MKENQKLKRGAGILLPISSLPSPCGIGTLGKEAYHFVDLLVKSGQKYWQVLPAGPTSYGDSPYQSFSAFAGNPYFIDLEILMEEGLVDKDMLQELQGDDYSNQVDYRELFETRFLILRRAFEQSKHEDLQEYKMFVEESQFWLHDYSFYMALKYHFDNRSWLLWEEKVRTREEETCNKYTKLLKDDIGFWNFCQFKFYQQWKRLKVYANQSGIQIVGDIPLYVAMDSADVWVHKDIFELDEDGNPVDVAGVPPDVFSETGQRWGNPLYDWKVLEKSGYIWWRERMKCNSNLYDVIRIDHFIGIVRYYGIPSSSITAEEGQWRRGPGEKLVKVIKESIGDSFIIAEDLGIITLEVRKLIEKTGWPGMKILQFAFDGDSQNEYLPHNYKTDNCIIYSGTHDNETLVGFFKNKKQEELSFIYEYLGVKRKKDISQAVIRLAYGSVANVVILPMQDILQLDNKARMNKPSTVGSNWKWRMEKGQFTEKHMEKLRHLVNIYGR